MYAVTDVGRIREHNEDTFLVADLESGQPLGFHQGSLDLIAGDHGVLFLVADGMGGAASGELASGMAGTLVLEELRRLWTQAVPSTGAFVTALRDATVTANAGIHQHARANPEHRGMGTTTTMAGLFGDQLYCVQVGDSRAYLVRDGVAQQLTKDQSLMQRLIEAGEITPEEAERSERRNIILQALGPEAHVTVDITHQQLRRGDTLIVCSDGLSGMVGGAEMAALTTSIPDVAALCHALVERANQRGGPDNITVVAVRFEGEALTQSRAGDAFGYLAFPLEGTMNDASLYTPAASFITTSPNIPRAVMPSPAASSERTATTTAPSPSAPLAPSPAEGRSMRPILLLLTLVAILSGAWTAWMVLRP